MSTLESLTIHPPPTSWRQLLRHNTSEQAKRFRRELNLPTDRPIIMTGHQPEFWHPGILAKYLAADAASAALNAHPAWLFVDQDRADKVELPYPARVNGKLSIGTATVRERKLPDIGDADHVVRPGLDLIRATLDHHSCAPTLSHQLSLTLRDLMKPYISLPHFTLFATEISRTSLFRQVVEKMAADPADCISQYNAAAARHPTSGIRPLSANDIQDRWELPLWHLPPGKPRTHVYAEDLANIPPHELAPKALLMTGLLRLAACDFFIHGLGAAETDNPNHEGYDIITEEWFDRWLGVPIAPMALVTATRFLPLSDSPPPTAADLARARWHAHHARHSPLLLRDPDAALAKQHTIDQIELLPRRTRARADLFRRLHATLTDFRQRHAQELSNLASTADATAAQLSQRDILFNRTWPFALFPEATLTAMANQLRAAF